MSVMGSERDVGVEGLDGALRQCMRLLLCAFLAHKTSFRLDKNEHTLSRLHRLATVIVR